MSALQIGIYERLLDEELHELLAANPELKPRLNPIMGIVMPPCAISHDVIESRCRGERGLDRDP